MTDPRNTRSNQERRCASSGHSQRTAGAGRVRGERASSENARSGRSGDRMGSKVAPVVSALKQAKGPVLGFLKQLGTLLVRGGRVLGRLLLLGARVLGAFLARSYRALAKRFGAWRVLLVIAAIVLILIIRISSCVASEPEVQQPQPENPPVPEQTNYSREYDWKNLEYEDNGYRRYVVDGKTLSTLGIDVSENQDDIDWKRVAADDIDFAIIRVGYRGITQGAVKLDANFHKNIDEASKAGLGVGAYFFSQAISVEEAQEEADFVIKQLNGRKLEYPVVFDSELQAEGLDEGRTAGLSNEQMTAIALAFCERVEEAGYTAMTYGNCSDMSRYNIDELEKYEVWWAEYDQLEPTAQMEFVMWQYSAQGMVDGIDMPVDLNIEMLGAVQSARKAS